MSMSTEYNVDIPVLKYFFRLAEHVQGFGIVNTFLLFGILIFFWRAHMETQLQKERYLSALSCLFAFFTVFGRSYSDMGNWDYIFGSKVQFCVAVTAMAGYFFLYKNSMIIGLICMKKWRGTTGKITCYVFERHPFAVPFAIFALTSIPYLICFFPGPIEWDAFSQYSAYFSMKAGEDVTAHYPIISTMWMGKCMDLGRALWDSDTWGEFLYTGPQYLIQWLIFAYVIYVICKMRGVPVTVKWFSLGYLALFPLWPIWGITLCKDVYYYLGILLWVTAMAHIVITAPQGFKIKTEWRQLLLGSLGVLIMTVSRKDGVFLVLFFGVTAVILCRKYVKLYTICVLAAAVLTILIEYVLMPLWKVGDGSIREAMSIPLQQTARYVLEHGYEIDGAEKEIMEKSFGEDWHLLGELYMPELSDQVKNRFIYYPTSKELGDYLKVWWRGFLRHPDTYIQATLNQIYGYFYTDADLSIDGTASYLLGDCAVRWAWDGLDIAYAIEDREVRDLFAAWANLIYNLPLIGLLSRCGMHTYLLFGCIAVLLSRKRGRDCFLLMPSVGVLLIALMSPVGNCVRYMLPVMALLPLNLAWGLYSTKKAETL